MRKKKLNFHLLYELVCCGCLKQFKRAYTSVMIVPTGVGAAIGGYAGDALPVARALASVVDCLISHPNVWFSSSFVLKYKLHTLEFVAYENYFKKWKMFEYDAPDMQC